MNMYGTIVPRFRSFRERLVLAIEFLNWLVHRRESNSEIPPPVVGVFPKSAILQPTAHKTPAWQIIAPIVGPPFESVKQA